MFVLESACQIHVFRKFNYTTELEKPVRILFLYMENNVGNLEK